MFASKAKPITKTTIICRFYPVVHLGLNEHINRCFNTNTIDNNISVSYRVSSLLNLTSGFCQIHYLFLLSQILLKLNLVVSSHTTYSKNYANNKSDGLTSHSATYLSDVLYNSFNLPHHSCVKVNIHNNTTHRSLLGFTYLFPLTQSTFSLLKFLTNLSNCLSSLQMCNAYVIVFPL